RPGRVNDNEDNGDTLCVVDDEGTTFQVPKTEALAVDPACLTGVDDLLTLGDFNEPALLHNIRVRYEEDKIYTGIGMPILISVNPYQNIPGLYSPETMRQYKRFASKAASQTGGGLPIHLYSVADAAFRAMLSEKANQSIIISGESGAGKTEATKRMLAYLAELQSSKHESGGRRSVESQVLDANPVLEAFGNAKTVRNDNSSRFGKFIEVEFDTSGKLLSAQISNYLLEKCRIVTQQPEERNYHFFYQLCHAALEGRVPESLKLRPASEFEYSKECADIAGVDDAADFGAVLDCMTSLGFSEEERDTIFRIAAAVLHLGELQFAPCAKNGADGVSVTNDSCLALACELLGLAPEQMRQVLEHKTLEDPLTEKIIHMPHDVSSASFTRHSMAKVVYARLFDWLVWRINESISSRGQQKDVRKIGLLDIYGFEVFEWNSFEQLCINFSNEKLQQHFNTHMFSLEQRLYSSEGITWSHITWQDNQHIIDTLDKRPLGLFCLVDSECLMPAATDASLFSKIQNAFKNSQVIYKASRFGNTDFAVAHYAGEVVYSVETFLMKNTDKLHKDVVSLFKDSKLELLKRLFTDPRFAPPEKPSAGDRGPARRRQSTREDRQRQNVTVSMMFREQLDRLVEDLNKTNPRYVRCIKPNAKKQPNELDSLDVLRQLRCAGMLESIRIRRAGYAVRRPFKEFFARFRILAPQLVPGPDPDYRSLCQRLVLEVEERVAKQGTTLPEKSWQLGLTRVFMKEDLERRMEQMIVESAKRQVQTIQRCWRGFCGRRRFQNLRRAALQFQAIARSVLAQRRFQDKQRAAQQLQAIFQSFRAQSRFAARRRAAVEVQACLRTAAAVARLAAAKARPPEPLEPPEPEPPEPAPPEPEPLAPVPAPLPATALAAPVTPAPAVDSEKGSAHAANGMATTPTNGTPMLPDLALERTEASPMGLSLDASIRNAALNLGGGSALDSLRTELMARLGDGAPASGAAGVGGVGGAGSAGGGVDPAHPLSSSLRNVEYMPFKSGAGAVAGAASGVASAVNAEQDARLSELPMRKTIMNQRKIMEQLREQFAQALKEEPTPLAAFSEAEGERVEQLEAELRRLRRENGTLKSSLFSSQEEAQARSSEAAELLLENSHLKSELDTIQFSHRDELQAERKQIQELLEREAQQRQEVQSLQARLAEVEGDLARWQSAAQEAKTVASSEKEEPSPLAAFSEAEGERMEQLEAELRRLRRENGTLKSSLFSSQEEAQSKSSEAAELLRENSHLKSELDTIQFTHRDELQVERKQIQATRREELQEREAQQRQEMQSLQARLAEVEGDLARWQSAAQEAKTAASSEKERFEEIEKRRRHLEQQAGDLRKERQDTDFVLKESQSSWRAEREKLVQDMKLKDRELGNLKQVLDNVTAAHVPKEELQKWKSRCDELQQQVDQANRARREMQSAVGHMTHAACARGGDLHDLQLRNQYLSQEYEKQVAEIKKMDLDAASRVTSSTPKGAWRNEVKFFS
ncbi:unnamed protein product, partial [Effrenium voratum]